MFEGSSITLDTSLTGAGHVRTSQIPVGTVQRAISRGPGEFFGSFSFLSLPPLPVFSLGWRGERRGDGISAAAHTRTGTCN